MKTIAQSLAEGLVALGYKRDPRKSNHHYQYFIHTTHPAISSKNGKPLYIIIGSKGALRRGTSITNSLVCSDAFRLQILEAQAKVLQSAFATL